MSKTLLIIRVRNYEYCENHFYLVGYFWKLKKTPFFSRQKFWVSTLRLPWASTILKGVVKTFLLFFFGFMTQEMWSYHWVLSKHHGDFFFSRPRLNNCCLLAYNIASFEAILTITFLCWILRMRKQAFLLLRHTLC